MNASQKHGRVLADEQTKMTIYYTCHPHIREARLNLGVSYVKTRPSSFHGLKWEKERLNLGTPGDVEFSIRSTLICSNRRVYKLYYLSRKLNCFFLIWILDIRIRCTYQTISVYLQDQTKPAIMKGTNI